MNRALHVLMSVVASAAFAVSACGQDAPEAHLPAPDEAAARHLAAGDAAAKAGAWTDAAKAYQDLLASGRGERGVRERGVRALCAAAPDLRLGARHLGRLRLRALPPEGLQTYRALFDGVARPLFEEGRRWRDAAALAEAARLYPFSTHSSAALASSSRWCL